MRYLLDTGFFIRSRYYYPQNFPSFWEKMGNAVMGGIVSSTREVRNELERYGGPQEHLLAWMKKNRQIFTTPNNDELEKVRQIFANKKFQRLLSNKAKNSGYPLADPFVIAKAWTVGCCVVTAEMPAIPNSSKIKIPDVCDYFGVAWASPEQFMQQQNWIF